MLKIKNYIKAESLEQAYELNQKRTACVLGGMVWLKMGNRNIMTAIDLSGLGYYYRNRRSICDRLHDTTSCAGNPQRAECLYKQCYP